MTADLTARAALRRKGHFFEEFTLGHVFEHHWGRTINQGDNSLFSTLTLHFNPLYYNVEFAKAHQHKDVVVNPMLVFNVVFGLSVQDLSESGGAFLGVENLTFHRPVHPGDTLTARSTVTDLRESASHKGMGIATWHTEGFDQHHNLVVDFHRTNLIRKRDTER